MTDYRTEIQQYAEEIKEVRKAIHRHPELGNEEWMTADRIESYLKGIGIEVRRILGTAVIGTLRGGKPGDGVAFRADIDALPLTEETGVPFASEVPGKMHACGHDVHTAALLGAARMLAAHREELPGTVVFLFQPDEEGNGGAERMIAEGCLEGVTAVFGAHVNPDLPAGDIGIRYGKFYASSDTFQIDVTGRGAHGAEREKGIDALAAAARITTELLALPPQVTDERCVVTVGQFHAGTAENILPGFAWMEGILRTLDPETRTTMKQRFRETVDRIASETGTTAELLFHESYPGVINEDSMTAFAEKTAVELLGAEHVHRLEEPTMTSEDYGFYLMKVPGSYYHIGAGCPYSLHNSRFLPPEEALLTAAVMHATVAEAYLNRKNGEA